MNLTMAEALRHAWEKLQEKSGGLAGVGADVGVGFVPGSGIAEYFGQLPSANGGMYPSFAENWGAGNYLDAGLQTLGAAGDLAMALPVVGVAAGTAMKAPGVARKLSRLDQARALLAAHETTTPGRILNQTRARGGYSVNLPTGELPTSGLMVGKYANTDPHNTVIRAPATPTRADVVSHTTKNLEPLSKNDMYLGTWMNQGDTYFDVSKRFEPGDVRKATKFGEKTGQLAGWDVGNAKEFPIGNWENFIHSDDYQRRLDEMAGVGSEYLKAHPTAEWWDMHGTSLERIYGTENLPQVAGMVASTAPNRAPRENMQVATEYMRRLINGEPVIQPDWRVPEGTMSRNAGGKIGMESTMRANLEKSARGDIDALRGPKVRNEARALMGDPGAVVIDRHQVRLGEDPARGVYATGTADKVTDAQYEIMLEEISRGAARNGRSPRDYSADVWTGIRETVKNTSELYGTPFKGASITGDSKSYADHFDDLIREKAAHLGIGVDEMERRLSAGDATLLSFLLATPLGAAIYREYVAGQEGA